MKRSIAALCVLALLESCSTAPKQEDRTQVCKAKFEKSEARFKKGEYWQIKDDLDEILTTCQGTGFSEQAQFLLAESHFRLEEWIEARGEYSSFVLNFPSSPFAETAAYRKAVSSFRMSYSDSRDESNTLTAIQDFERFRGDHPSSGLLDSVAIYLDSLVERQADREYNIARLYWRMDEPQASAIYLKEFLDTYPRSKHWKSSALLLVDCYIMLEQFDQARFYLERLRSTSANDASTLSEAKDRDARIASAQKDFQNRLIKEQKQKLQRKEDEN